MQKSDKIQLFIGAIAVPVAITGVTMLETNPKLAFILFGVAGIAFVWGIYPYVFKKRRKKITPRKQTKQQPIPKINYESIKNVTPEDKKLINLMVGRMWSIHGHLDIEGLMSDRGSGVPVNDLMEKLCSKCGMPRNRKGRDI